jgi:hypothetical protein
MPPKQIIPAFPFKKKYSQKKQQKSLYLLDRLDDCNRSGQYLLDISTLKLEQWPEELVILGGVRLLLAFNNKLTILPNLASSFKWLEHLDLSRNCLDNVDSIEFSHLHGLKYCNLSRNELVRLPVDITKASALETLIIDRNRLTELPNGMFNLKKLQILNSSHNLIEHIGDNLEGLNNLDDLNLSENPNLDIVTMGPQCKRVYDKRLLLASKANRRILITRALGIQKSTMEREQNLIYSKLEEEKEIAEQASIASRPTTSY